MAIKNASGAATAPGAVDTIMQSNRPFYQAEKMAIDESTTIIPKIEKIVSNDMDMATDFWKRVKQPGAKFGENAKGLWKGMVENSGGSKIKAASRLGAYAAGVAMVADLLNPLSPGWGD